MDNQITQALQRYHDRVSHSREVMFTALYGSQNYGLDTPESDVDAYCITVPSKHELVFDYPSGEDPAKNTPSSAYCYDTGKVTVKDIRQMMDAYASSPSTSARPCSRRTSSSTRATRPRSQNSARTQRKSRLRTCISNYVPRKACCRAR